MKPRYWLLLAVAFTALLIAWPHHPDENTNPDGSVRGASVVLYRDGLTKAQENAECAQTLRTINIAHSVCTVLRTSAKP